MRTDGDHLRGMIGGQNIASVVTVSQVTALAPLLVCPSTILFSFSPSFILTLKGFDSSIVIYVPVLSRIRITDKIWRTFKILLISSYIQSFLLLPAGFSTISSNHCCLLIPCNYKNLFRVGRWIISGTTGSSRRMTVCFCFFWKVFSWLHRSCL